MFANQLPVDLFTKAFGTTQFQHLFSKLGVFSMNSNFRMSVKELGGREEQVTLTPISYHAYTTSSVKNNLIFVIYLSCQLNISLAMSHLLRELISHVSSSVKILIK
jgi:hypothetical protein